MCTNSKEKQLGKTQLEGIIDEIEPDEIISAFLVCHQASGGVTVALVVSEHLTDPDITTFAVIVVVPRFKPVKVVIYGLLESEVGDNDTIEVGEEEKFVPKQLFVQLSL